MSTIRLQGCRSEPLASYLKSLGILRLVAEQKDPEAKAWWADDSLCLESSLDETALVRFFIEEYAPTPFVAPWNGGSGFYMNDTIEGREAIRASGSVRFAEYRAAISAILTWPELPPTELLLGEMIRRIEEAAAQKQGRARDELLGAADDVKRRLPSVEKSVAPDDPLSLSLEQLQERVPRGRGKELLHQARKLRTQVNKLCRAAGKGAIVQACRSRLSDRALEWIDAAVAIGADGELAYPPLLGTAANEGRLDYTNAFMQRVAELLIAPPSNGTSAELLRNALFGDPTTGLVIASVGQHDPGRAGGYNQGFGIETKDFPTNPWNFILMMEGTVVWASSITRRDSAALAAFLCSPFTVRARPVGYSSSSDSDQAGARAEIWAPVWRRPVPYRELRTFLGEGRAEIGRRRASDGIEFAEAATSLGIDRGISEFVRYSLLKRRGDSYIALPAGHFPAQARTESDLLRQLDPILHHVDRFLRSFKSKGQEPPASFTSARRAVDEAVYALLLQGGAPRLKMLVARLGQIERLFAERDRTKDPKLLAPLSGLDAKWVMGADDGSLEVRVAAVLASIGPSGKVGPMRANLARVDPSKPWAWAAGEGQHAWAGNSLCDKIAAVLARRMMDAGRLGCDENPLRSLLSLPPEDVAAFIEGDLDERLVEDLLFGFSWVRWNDSQSVRPVQEVLHKRWKQSVSERIVPRSWALIKLVFLPGSLRGNGGEEIRVRPEPSVVPLLRAGRIGDACRVAQRRLFAAGLAPLQADLQGGEDGIRLAAALLLPVTSISALMRKVLVQAQRAS